jgi:cytochrome c-type biogenesis protein CcmH/NrfG
MNSHAAGAGRARSARGAAVGAAVLLLLAGAAGAWQPAPSKAVAARIKRDVANCKRSKNLETCDDAVRWDPSDPALLVAFGDALMRTQHPADALRQYQRAASLSPKLPGVAAKISAAEARLPSKRGSARVARAQPQSRAPAPSHAAVKAPVARNAVPSANPLPTNDAADSQTH